MKIQAAVVKDKGSAYEIQDINLAEIGNRDILVKIVASGICRSDYGERNGYGALAHPNVLGHEGSGIVEKVGSAVTSVQVGDHVILSYAYCKNCEHCDKGHPASCKNWLPLNVGGTNVRGEYILHTEDKTPLNNFFNQSSFATYRLTDESNIVKVAKDLDLRIVGPLGCGLATGSGAVLNVLKPSAGSSIVIFGTGAVGFSAIMAAKIVGCSQIIAVDINDLRLETALEIGATHVINSMNKDIDLIARIQEITNGNGVDFSIDTSGVIMVMQQALKVLNNSGTFVPLAVTKNNFEVNTFFDLVFGNKKIAGVLIGDSIPKLHLPVLLDFYKKGMFQFDRFIKFYAFKDIVQAEQDLIDGKIIKAVLIMDESYQAHQ